MKTYLFNIETGYMTLVNAKPKHIRTETTNGVTTTLDEIRSSDLEYDSATHTLQIVDDEVTVVERPPRPVVVPSEVTNYQVKQALNANPADRQAVDAFVAASGDQNIIDGWQYASSFKKDHPLFLGAVAYLGWSQQKVDDLLILAATFD